MLNFSRGQRNGLVVLAFLIFFSLLIPYVFDSFKEDYTGSFEIFEKEINNAKKAPKKLVEESIQQVELFDFNPNTSSEKDFQQLGFSDKQIKQIVNYRNKNGHFYSKEDLKKIYAIDESTFKRVEAYIVIPTRKQNSKSKYSPKKKLQKKTTYKNITVEINSVDEIDLQKVRGLGSTFSKRIIKYRNSLGGFVDKKQLLEVYGIDQEKYSQINNQITINPKLVKKININFATAKEIKTHPYIGKNKANSILKNRTFNGRFKSLKDLQKRMKWSDDYTQKIKAYLEF